MSKKNTKEDTSPSFEDSMKRLEALVEDMESGDLSLDKMIEHFEEGSGLVKICSEKLEEVEQKIEILVKKEGKFVAEPFDEVDKTADKTD